MACLFFELETLALVLVLKVVLFYLDAFEGFDGLFCAIGKALDVARALAQQTCEPALHETEHCFVDGSAIFCRLGILSDIGYGWTGETSGDGGVSKRGVLGSGCGDI